MRMRVRHGRMVGPLVGPPTPRGLMRQFARYAVRVGKAAQERGSAQRQREIRERVVEAFRALSAGALVGRIVTALRNGDITAAEAAAMAGEAQFRTVMQATIQTVMRQVVASGGQALEVFGVRYRADQAAIDWALAHSAQLVVEITESTRQAIREVVARAVRDGLHPHQAADLLENMVGLHSRYATAVYNYAEGLRASGLAPDQLAELVGRYYDKLLADRADTIARTEILDAANQGKLLGWQQAEADNLMTAASTKQWIAAEDERMCPICADLDGSIVPMNGEFSNGRMMPPAHPNCRCTAALIAASPVPAGVPAAEVA